jgi:hypothetical protein
LSIQISPIFEPFAGKTPLCSALSHHIENCAGAFFGTFFTPGAEVELKLRRFALLVLRLDDGVVLAIHPAASAVETGAAGEAPFGFIDDVLG